ncbi:phosphatase PAP2 family protein [Acidocella sp.]|uniref:phosphatase PAP2 family protein n=1 Tax=Acidocella sp. TaxID=50710 RepID=UPI003CFF4D62
MRYPAAWLIAGLILTDACLFARSGLRLAWKPALSIVAAAALLSLLAWIYSGPRRAPRLALTAELGAKLILFSAAAETLNMLLDAWAPLPLWDSRLAALDAALGFHWPVLAGWVMAHPPIRDLLSFAYLSLGPEFIALLLLLSLSGHAGPARRLWRLFAATGLLTVLIGTAMPAAGAFVWFHAPAAATTAYVQQYAALRAGTLRTVNLATAQGLVSFPSFHACLALLCLRAAGCLPPVLRWPLRLLNILVIAASPTMGGHYLSDILGGLALGGGALLAGRTSLAARPAPSRAIAE